MFVRVSVAAAATSMTMFSLCAVNDKKTYKNNDVSQRLKIAFPCEATNPNLNFRKLKRDGVKIFSPKKGTFGLLPNCRAATVDINAPMDEIISTWISQGLRAEWDSEFCKEAQIIHCPSDNGHINYVLTKASYIAPSREFYFTLEKNPGAVLGVNDYRIVVFGGADASDEVLKTTGAVRAHMNSLLILEPKSAQLTRATYVTEVNDGGWFHPWFVDFVADQYVNSLSALKQELESAEKEVDSAGTIEEAARLRFLRHQNAEKKLQGKTIVDDIVTNKADLQSAITVMEQRLRDLRQTERGTGPLGPEETSGEGPR